MMNHREAAYQESLGHQVRHPNLILGHAELANVHPSSKEEPVMLQA